MAEKDFTILTKAEELAEHTLRVTSNCNHYPKKYRHSLVDKMQNKSLDIYTTLYEANRINNVTNKYMRLETITKGITYCDELLFFIKLSKNLGQLGGVSVEHWVKLTTDVKRMSLAWRKKEQN